MDLKTKHYKENNTTCLLLGFLIQAFMLAASFLYKDGRWFSTTAMLIVQVICLIISIVGYIKLSSTEYGHFPLLIALATDYMIMLLGSFHTPYMWAFGALIGILVVVYDDMKVCKLACSVALTENTIFLIMYYAKGFSKESTARFMVPTNYAFVVLFAIICFVVVKTNSNQRIETMADIAASNEK